MWRQAAVAGAGALGTAIGGPLIGAAGGFLADKIMGVPSPEKPKTGAALGHEARAAQEAQYPGTNPWERLGAPGYAGAGTQTARAAGQVQRSLQSKDLASKERVAKIHAQATLGAAATSVAPREALVQPERIKMTAETDLISQKEKTEFARTLAEGHNVKIKHAKADMAKKMAAADYTAKQTANMSAFVLNTMRGHIEPERLAGAMSVRLGKAGVAGYGLLSGAKAFFRALGSKKAIHKKAVVTSKGLGKTPYTKFSRSPGKRAYVKHFDSPAQRAKRGLPPIIKR